MKKLFTVLLLVTMLLSLCACGNTDSVADFPFVGTWVNSEEDVYLRIMENGEIKSELIATINTTNTHNGVKTEYVKKSISGTFSATWNLEGNKFMFNGKGAFDPVEEDGVYSLVSEETIYTRVGELDYEISLETTESSEKKLTLDNAEKYVLGTIVAPEGFELVLNESGVKEDIRITSKSSGISITSGPSAETGKKYVYLKGTLKNTGKTAVKPAIAGKIYLDDYEFDLSEDIIGLNGSMTAEIDPLDTVNVLLYAKISDEMESKFSDGKIYFGFNDNFSDVMLEKAQYLYFVEVTR